MSSLRSLHKNNKPNPKNMKKPEFKQTQNLNKPNSLRVGSDCFARPAKTTNQFEKYE